MFWTLIAFQLWCYGGLVLGEPEMSSIRTRYATYFYELAFKFMNVVRNNAEEAAMGAHFNTVHLIRVPKAGSTSLSIIARRLAGCSPPGPCCKYPGDPIGSCPSNKLFACQVDKRVIGCTDHYPNLPSLSNSAIPSIAILRDPYKRSLSAFFYPGKHHNYMCHLFRREGTTTSESIKKRMSFQKHLYNRKNGIAAAKSQVTCFEEYANSMRWRNVAVKMFTGAYAYDNVPSCATAKQCQHSLEAAIANIEKTIVMAIMELWELSLLVLHLSLPGTAPDRSEFHLVGNSSVIRSQEANTGNRDYGNEVNQKVKDKRFVPKVVPVSQPFSKSLGLQQMIEKGSDISPTSIPSRGHPSSSWSELRYMPYPEFKAAALNTSNDLGQHLQEALQRQNELDVRLYAASVKRLCRQVQDLGLWKDERVRSYWQAYMPNIECIRA